MKSLIVLFLFLVALHFSIQDKIHVNNDANRKIGDGVVPNLVSENENPIIQHHRVRRWVCNDLTGDFLCAGWPGAWRCTCGAACYGGTCTCKRCI